MPRPSTMSPITKNILRNRIYLNDQNIFTHTIYIECRWYLIRLYFNILTGSSAYVGTQFTPRAISQYNFNTKVPKLVEDSFPGLHIISEPPVRTLLSTFSNSNNAIVSSLVAGRPINTLQDIFLQVMSPSLLGRTELPYDRDVHIYVGFFSGRSYFVWRFGTASVKLKQSPSDADVRDSTLGYTT